MGPYSAIISDSCDNIGTYVGVLIEFCFPRVFKYCLLVYTCDLLDKNFHVFYLYCLGLVFVSWLLPSIRYDVDLLLNRVQILVGQGYTE